MKKTIFIDNNEYNLRVSALTPLRYKNLFNSEMMKDLSMVAKGTKGLNENNIDDLIEMAGLAQEVCLKLMYSMLDTNNSFEDFCDRIETFTESEMLEVLNLALSTFRKSTER